MFVYITLAMGSTSNGPSINIGQKTVCPILLLPDPPTVETDFKINGSPKIVGGRPSGRNIARYLVYLENSSGLACSGTMVAPNIVITAAHCELGKGSSAYIGGLSSREGTKIEVAKVIRSSEYRPIEQFFASLYDFSIVVLSQRAPRNTGYMSVNVNKSIPEEGSICRVAGYGKVAEDSSSGGKRKLLQVDVPIPDKWDCQIATVNGYNHSNHVCAGYESGGCDSCSGDSGGPLIQYDRDDNPVLVGVVSFGSGCARPKKHAVYSRTWPYIEMYSKYSEIKLVNQTKAVFLENSSGLPYPSSLPPMSETTGRSSTIIVVSVIGSLVPSLVVVTVIVSVIMKRRRASKSAGDSTQT